MGVASVHYKPGADLPAKAASAIKGGTFVKVSAKFDGRNPVIAPAGAGDAVLGVAAHDAAAGEYVTVYRGGTVVEVSALSAVKAGSAVAAGADGKAAVADSAAGAVGIALSDSTGGVAAVALR